MNESNSSDVISRYYSFIGNKEFPCIGAKAALAKDQISFFVADHFGCPKDDHAIIQFMYDFVDKYRMGKSLYETAVIIFKGPVDLSEEKFEDLFWQRLQSISNIDAQRYPYDTRVGCDPSASTFSFSLKEESFYLIGLHPQSSRKSRRFSYPAIVFNPHAQFERLREISKYEPMKQAVRARDIRYSGSVNPMLADFGESSEVFQYSGRQYDKDWKCPFIALHENAEYNSPS